MRKLVEGYAVCVKEMKVKEKGVLLNFEIGSKYHFYGIEVKDNGISGGVIFLDIPESHISIKFGEVVFNNAFEVEQYIYIFDIDERKTEI